MMREQTSKQAARKRFLAILLSAVLAFTVFAAMPMTASAATSEAVIDLSAFPNNNSASSHTDNSSASESQWVYENMWGFKSLRLITDGGNYKIKGTQATLGVDEGSNCSNIKITLSNVNFKILGISSTQAAVTLEGINKLSNSGGDGLSIGVGKSCTLGGTGELIVSGTIKVATDASLVLGDSAKLTVTNTSATDNIIPISAVGEGSLGKIWMLQGATTINSITDITINVLVPAGKTATVWRAVAAAPSITGPTMMTVENGYGPTTAGPFTAVGTPDPVVSITSGDAVFTWNDKTKMIDIGMGLAPGTYPVTLKADNGISPAAVATFKLTVGEPPSGPDYGDWDVTSIGTPLKTIYLVKGSSLTVPCVPYEVYVKAPVPVTFTSSDSKIVKATKGGKITGVKTGKTTVTVKALNKSMKLTVYVVSKQTKLTGATVTVPASMKKYSIKAIAVKPVPLKATGVKVTFKSSDSKGLRVDKAGMLSALKKGTYTITVTVGSHIYKKKVSVK